MKKFLLIPLLALFTCVNAWGTHVDVSDASGLTTELAKENPADTINVTAKCTLTVSGTIDCKGSIIKPATKIALTISPSGDSAKLKNGTIQPTDRVVAVSSGSITFEDFAIKTSALELKSCTVAFAGNNTVEKLKVTNNNVSLINNASSTTKGRFFASATYTANLTNNGTFIFAADVCDVTTINITNNGTVQVEDGAIFNKSMWDNASNSTFRGLIEACCTANSYTIEPWASGSTEQVKIFATEPNHVAKIGTVKYPTLLAAVVAADENAIIYLTEQDVNKESVSISKNLTINGGTGASRTLDCAFSISEDKTLTLINVTVQPTSSNNTVTLSGANAKLILSKAHIVGKSAKYAIYNNTTDATIEVAENTTNSIVNTPGSTSSYTLYGKRDSRTTIQGNGYLSVENNGTPTTTGYLFGVPSGRTAAFVLDAPNATYTYVNGRNIGSGTATITHNSGDYTAEVPVPEVIDGKNVYKVYTYTQIEAALNAASDGDVIRLIENPSNNDVFIKIPKQIVINKSITLDFNRVLLYPNEQPDVIQIGQDALSTNTVTFTAPTTGVTVGGFKDEILLPLGSFVKVYSNLVINGGEFNRTQQGNEGCALNLMPGANVTINEGRFNGKKYVIYSTADADYATNLTINGGTFAAEYTTLTDQSSVLEIRGNVGADEAYSNTTTINGGSFSGGFVGAKVLGKGAVLNVAGGLLDGRAYAIAGNGTAACGGTLINISGGTIGSETTQAAIYHPQNGQLVISGNPVIKGQNAIQLCAGVGMTGSITGGRFEAYGEDERATKGGDGLIPDGAALSIVNRNYPGGMPQFTIKGGVFLAQHQDAILAYSWDNSQPAGSKHSEWAAAKSHLSAREGIFSSDPTPFVPADGYTVTHLNPTPTVYNHDAVVYADLWQVGEADHVQSYDFTPAESEYVEISSTTPSEKLEDKTYTLNEDQSSKKVEVKENYTLVVSEDVTLNIGNGGLDLNNNSQVVVEAGAVVTVGMNGITSASGVNNLVLESNSEKQAVLLLDPDVIQNTQPLATVVLSTKAKQKSANPWNYIWEYFACPVAEITELTKPTNNFDAGVHGLFAGESEFITGVYTWGGNDWTLVNSWMSLVPFKGYQLTNNSANGGVEYTFKGNLLGNSDGEYAFTSNGYGYFGNSYSAPIVISNFLSALDNSVYERTVWLYDAGADTYVSINPLAARIGSAKYKDGTVIKEIRSLQAFILNKKADGGNAPINYRDAIWNNPRINSLVSASPAPARRETMLWTNIAVAAEGNKEMVTLVEGEDFSNAFDNGADAGKYLNANSMNLYAATNDGEQAIVATDNLENTLISFQAGNATEYTLSFENGNEDYMLRDNVTGMTVAMEEGAEYTFTQAANTTVPARFEVIAAPKTATAIENVEEAAKATGIYTITGQYMGRDFTNLPAGVYVVNGVKIVK